MTSTELFEDLLLPTHFGLQHGHNVLLETSVPRGGRLIRYCLQETFGLAPQCRSRASGFPTGEAARRLYLPQFRRADPESAAQGGAVSCSSHSGR